MRPQQESCRERRDQVIYVWTGTADPHFVQNVRHLRLSGAEGWVGLRCDDHRGMPDLVDQQTGGVRADARSTARARRYAPFNNNNNNAPFTYNIYMYVFTYIHTYIHTYQIKD